MSWEIIAVIVLLLGALASFVLERIPPDLTSLSVFAILLVAATLPFEHDLPSINSLLGVLANPAPLTVAAMFILSAALERCGGIDLIAEKMQNLTRLGFLRFFPIMLLIVATISAFVNNTPVVMVFMPVVLGLTRHLDRPASKLLIPLSYASIFGGTCTLVGTSTNILASGLLVSHGRPPLSMFELSLVGVPLMAIGILYLILFGGRILPNRETLTSILSEEERKEYMAEAFVQNGSPAVGKTLREAGLLAARGVRILEVIRNNVAITVDPRKTLLAAGDRLVLACRPAGFAHARGLSGIDLSSEMGLPLETISAQEGSLVEGVIGPRSTLAGRTIREINFRQRFRVIVVAIHRKGINLREKVETLPLEFGDTLLLMGTDNAIEELRRKDDILLLDRPRTPAVSRNHKLPVVIAILAGVVGLASLGAAPIAVLAIAGVAAAFLTGCISPKDGYASIEWPILILIYGTLGLGEAMESSGTAQLIAQKLAGAAAHLGGPALTPILLLIAVYLTTTTFTEILSNNAAIVLMAPIALTLGMEAGIDPRPLIIAATIAASASFATPIGYQTNTYVYGVGGYKFTDFLKIGLPLNLLYFVGSITLIPLIWSF